MRISPYFYLKGFYGSFSQYESDITDIYIIFKRKKAKTKQDGAV